MKTNINCGIYRWINKLTGQSYVGQSSNLGGRKEKFLRFEEKYSGKKINKARLIYNHPCFWKYQILEFCQPSELNDKEKQYIQLFESVKNGYNMINGKTSNKVEKKKQWNFCQLFEIMSSLYR